MPTFCIIILQRDKQKRSMLILTFDIALGLIAGFSSRKMKAEASLNIKLVVSANENNHEHDDMGPKKGKRCK